MDKARFFIGIPIENEAKAQIINACSKLRGFKDIKWVEKENLHITLKFIGETPEEKLETLKSAVDKCAAGTEGFFIKFNSLSAFPSEKNAKIIWAGIDKNHEKLAMLAAKLEKSTADMGFVKEERQFIGHATTGRAGRSEDISGAVTSITLDADSKVSSIILYASRREPAGMVYTAIYEKKL